MTPNTVNRWDSKRTPETRKIEELLRERFDAVDSYRYNSASIRVRVVDQRFEGMSRQERDALVEEHIATLPAATQRDIVTLLTFAPSEVANGRMRESLLNLEFEDPSPSRL